MPIDPVTTGLTVIGGKLAYDALGPTAKYLGEGTKELTAVGLNNIKRTFKYAVDKKLLAKNSDGSVPARLIPTFLESAYYVEDELIASYLGGVLASSTSPEGRDDRAVSFIKALDNLSCYSIRLHSIIYSSVVIQTKQENSVLKRWLHDQRGVTVVFDEEHLFQKMAFLETEDAPSIIDHSFIALNASGLCELGGASTWEKQKTRWCRLTLRGVELFVWGCGYGQAGLDTYLENLELTDELKDTAIQPLMVELGNVSFS